MNRRLGGVVTPVLIALFAAAAAGEKIPVRVAGQVTTADAIRQDGEILLHLTPLLPHLGATAQYSAEDESIVIGRAGLPTLSAKVGSTQIRVGAETKELALAPTVEEGKSYFPLYSLARLMGLYVREDDSGTVIINPAVTRIEVVKEPLPEPKTGIAPAAPPPARPDPPSAIAAPGEPHRPKPVGAPVAVKTEIAPLANAAALPPARLTRSKLVIEAGAPVKFTVKTLNDPFRVYADLEGASLIGGSGERYRGSGDLLVVRASQFSIDPDIVRVVAEFASEVPYRLDTKSPGSRIEITCNAVARPDVRLVGLQVKELSPTVTRVLLSCDGFSAYQQSVLHKPSRVVVDLAGTDATGVVAPDVSKHRLLRQIRVANVAEPAGTARVALELKQMTAMTVGRTSAKEIAVDLVTAPLSKKIVVVDAGHGGKDPGAQYGGAKEKDLVLDIAKRIHARLVKAKVAALMTRADDTFIPLGDRCEFANNAKADLFLSVHLNAAYETNKSSGTEVYYYTDRSLPFAIAVHDKLTKALKLKDGGLRKRMLYVCHHTNMPSVLTEACYLNNDAEIKLATNPVFRQRVADSIFQAVKSYVEGPPAAEPTPPTPTAEPARPKPVEDAAASTVTSPAEGERP